MTFDDVLGYGKEAAKHIAGGAAAAGSGIGAVAACGVPGLSAAGITSGLAVLGAGSMLLGIGTVGFIGFGAYQAAKYVTTKIVD